MRPYSDLRLRRKEGKAPDLHQAGKGALSLNLPAHHRKVGRRLDSCRPLHTSYSIPGKAFDLAHCFKNGASEARQPVRKPRKGALWSGWCNGIIVVPGCP